MSFSNPVSMVPGIVVTAGIVALVLGYRTIGWILIGVPVVLGILVVIWALVADSRKPG
jgi:hypothetical protein